MHIVPSTCTYIMSLWPAKNAHNTFAHVYPVGSKTVITSLICLRTLCTIITFLEKFQFFYASRVKKLGLNDLNTCKCSILNCAKSRTSSVRIAMQLNRGQTMLPTSSVFVIVCYLYIGIMVRKYWLLTVNVNATIM